MSHIPTKDGLQNTSDPLLPQITLSFTLLPFVNYIFWCKITPTI